MGSDGRFDRAFDTRKLDRVIRVERASVTIDAFGGEVTSWSVLADGVGARVSPVGEGERLRAGELGADIATRFRIGWGLDVRVTDRIVHEGRIHAISAVTELGRRAGQETTAAARAEAV